MLLKDVAMKSTSNDAAGWFPFVRVLQIVLATLLVSTCGGGGGSAGGATDGLPPPAAATPAAPPVTTQAASTVRLLEVPAPLALPPLNVNRGVSIPPGFGMRVWARVPKARFMALAPNGDVLVSVPSDGTVQLLRNQPDGTAQVSTYASDLHNPHDMVFHRIGETTYLYIAESNRITRSIYTNGEATRAASEIVLDNLPDDSTEGLRGAYGHELKNIALSPDDRLYVSIASTCNACAADTTSNPVRGAIYQYNANGSNGRLFARGLRNAEGLDFVPGTNTLWVTVNGRDEIRVPVDIDVDGDGQRDLGKLLPAFVDTNPPEIFTAMRDGGNYGWPFCNPVPNPGMANMDLLPDYEWNRDGSSLNCAAADRASKGIAAHSAPLGFSFLQASNVPPAYRSGAAVALHGCWNCTNLTAGFRVAFIPFDAAGNAGAEIDLVAGFVINPVAREVWGRPVDVIPDARGNLLISDDYAGAVYQLYPL